jgi:hypothetical protein
MKTYHLLCVGAALCATLTFPAKTLADGCPDVSGSYSDTVNTKVTQQITAADNSCIAGDVNSNSACNAFVGFMVDNAYNIPDFRITGGYLNAAGLNNFLSSIPPPANWVPLGTLATPASQTILIQAQNDANQGKAVIALSSGHVALVIPSMIMVGSGSFGACVPMSAAHFLGHPEKNYDAAPLANSFTSPNGVQLWEHS